MNEGLVIYEFIVGNETTLFSNPHAYPCDVARAIGNTGSTDIPIRHVTLYTSGVGFFERAGTIDGDTTEALFFPTGEINDVLKSLVFLDTGGGTIEPVEYAAQDPIAKRLQEFSVDLSDNPDQADILNRVRGADVTVTFSVGGTSTTIDGTVVGVESHKVSLPNNQSTQQSLLNIYAADGMHSIDLALVTALQFDDPSLRQEIHEALKALASGRDDTKRAVSLQFHGQGKRTVSVGYLTETPLWQTTYRLVLGKQPMIQGWANVQNTSQEDWNNVGLSLVSGRPISFIQDLYTPVYVPRPTVQPNVAEAPTPQSYGSNLDASNAPEPQAAAPAGQDALGMEQKRVVITGEANFVGIAGVANSHAFQPAPIMQSLQTSGAKLGTALFAYNIAVPVSIPRGQSAMIPFLAGPFEAERVSIYNASVEADHPLTGARLTNTTGLHLMGGPITVFDTAASGDTGYVGDALIDDTEPSQVRLISFAVDLAVDAASSDDTSSSQTQSITIKQGVITETDKQTDRTKYTFKNNAQEDRTIVVEHPDEGSGWTLIEPKNPSEHTADLYRFDVVVPAKASKSLAVAEENIQFQTVNVTDCDDDTLVSYSKNGVIDPAVLAALQGVLKRRRVVADLNNQIAALTNQVNGLSQNQDRIRKNMGALDHASDLYKRYATELDRQETQIEAMQSRQDDLQNQLTQATNDLNNYIANLTVS